MKIICLQEKFKDAVVATERVAGKNIHLPVLNNLLLQAEKNQITITSTDLEIAITRSIPGKIEREGKATVPAKLLSTFVNNLAGSKKIALESKKNNLWVKTEDYKAQILGSDPEEFPIIPRPKKKEELFISSQELTGGLERVVRSVGVSEVRPEITGVLFKTDSSQGTLALVSTDSFRLTEKKISLRGVKIDTSFILPIKTVNEVIRIFGGTEQQLSFVISEQNQVVIKNENSELVSRLIDGEFPRYEGTIPSEVLFRVSFLRSVLVPKIKAVSAFAGRSSDVVFRFSEDQVEISAREAGLGEGTAKLVLGKPVSHQELSVVFNWKFLVDGIESIDSDEVVFGINSEVQPVLLTPPAGSDSRALYLIMPIKNT